jgi:hypothetical protein
MTAKAETVGRRSMSAFRTILWAMCALFLAFYLYKFHRYLFVSSNLTEYLRAENLYHYPGLYIRRSLLGNFFILFPPAYWTHLIQVFYMAVILFVLWHMLRNRPHLPGLVLFLYMPFGLRLVILDSFGLYRKEMVFYLAIILIIALFRRKRGRYVNLLVTIALGALMIMVHESFLFLGVPVCIWVMHLHKTDRRDIAVFAAAMVILWPVLAPDITSAQLEALDKFFAGHGMEWGDARIYLSKDRVQMMEYTVGYFIKGPILFFLGLLIPFLIYLRHIRVLEGEPVKMLFVQLTAALFLCLLGTDYGRWFTFAVSSWFVVLFHFTGMEGLKGWLERSRLNQFIFVFSLLAMLSYHVPVNMTYLDADYTLKENFILMHLRKFFIENGL